jgi:hypothetical protein
MSVNNLHTCSTDIGVLVRDIQVDQVFDSSHTCAATSINHTPHSNDAHSRCTAVSQVEFSRFRIFDAGSCLLWSGVPWSQ